MTDITKNKGLTESILEVINERKPQSVKQLITILKETLYCSEDDILGAVLKLQAKGEIQLENQTHDSRNLTAFTLSEGLWYLLTIAIGAITVCLVFIVPENFYPWIYARNFLGVIFVLFLPGYAFAKAVFPNNILEKGIQLEIIARIALSLGISIALVSIVGLLSYYAPWGLNLPAIVITLFAVTAIAATAGVLRFADK